MDDRHKTGLDAARAAYASVVGVPSEKVSIHARVKQRTGPRQTVSDEQIAAALAEHGTARGAARALGVDEKVIRKRRVVK